MFKLYRIIKCKPKTNNVMNIPDVNNLRVAVIPTEKDNSITTSSSIEEILACDDLMLYTITLVLWLVGD